MIRASIISGFLLGAAIGCGGQSENSEISLNSESQNQTGADISNFEGQNVIIGSFQVQSYFCATGTPTSLLEKHNAAFANGTLRSVVTYTQKSETIRGHRTDVVYDIEYNYKITKFSNSSYFTSPSNAICTTSSGTFDCTSAAFQNESSELPTNFTLSNGILTTTGLDSDQKFCTGTNATSGARMKQL